MQFYGERLGFIKIGERAGSVVLSARAEGPDLIILKELKSARPKPARSSGLYHVAIRFSSRRELGRVFRRLYEASTEFHGFSDHLVSEAIYLADPDGNGIELYVDRPREQWEKFNDQIKMATEPLDLESLVSELKGDTEANPPIDPKTDIGHVHLHVSDLVKAEEFYHGIVGFDVTQRSYPGALFMSAGGYHHHLGVNTWAGKGAPPPPADAVGLLRFGIVLPDGDSLEALKNNFQELGREMGDVSRVTTTKGAVRIVSPDGMIIELLANE